MFSRLTNSSPPQGFLLDSFFASHMMGHMPQYETRRSPYQVQVLDRALGILDVVGAGGRDHSLAELCAALQLHKSTVHRLMMVLERHRLVDKNPDTGRYRLGFKLFELGSKAIAALDLREHARPHLNRVLKETEETVHFCILDQGEVLYIEKMEPQRSVRMASSIGRRAPAYCTAVGKAMMAELTDAEVDEIVRRYGLKAITARTITSAAALRSNLKIIRARGYAVDNEENEEGVRCVGTAVRDYLGRPVAAISVSAPAFRMGKSAVQLIACSVVKSAGALSRELGYQPARSREKAAGTISGAKLLSASKKGCALGVKIELCR
jgi:DNA-binding IclR family transcriptional regulator